MKSALHELALLPPDSFSWVCGVPAISELVGVVKKLGGPLRASVDRRRRHCLEVSLEEVHLSQREAEPNPRVGGRRCGVWRGGEGEASTARARGESHP